MNLLTNLPDLFAANLRFSANQPARFTQVMAVLKSTCKNCPDSQPALRGAGWQEAEGVVKSAIERNAPIDISFCWAISAIIASPVNFITPVNLPRLGDVWGIWWWLLLAKKIGQFHPPGLRVTFIDEVETARMLGFDAEAIARKQCAMREIIKKAESHGGIEFRIIDLPGFETTPDVPVPADKEILPSLSSMVTDEHDPLYVALVNNMYRSNCSFGDIKQAAGNRWNQALSLKTMINRNNAGRRMHRFVEQHYKVPYISASMIVQEGRYVPNIWVNTNPAHGNVICQNGDAGKRSAKVVEIESRLKHEKTPVMVEFEGTEYIGYWV
jgi:hypothetical protein